MTNNSRKNILDVPFLGSLCRSFDDYFSEIGPCLTLNNSVISGSISIINDKQKKNKSLIFEFDDEISEIICNEKDEDEINF